MMSFKPFYVYTLHATCDVYDWISKKTKRVQRTNRLFNVVDRNSYFVGDWDFNLTPEKSLACVCDPSEYNCKNNPVKIVEYSMIRHCITWNSFNNLFEIVIDYYINDNEVAEEDGFDDIIGIISCDINQIFKGYLSDKVRNYFTVGNINNSFEYADKNYYLEKLEAGKNITSTTHECLYAAQAVRWLFQCVNDILLPSNNLRDVLDFLKSENTKKVLDFFGWQINKSLSV